MKIRQYQRDVETLKKEASAILNASEDSKYIHKVAMVNLVIKGTITAADLADGLEITRQSISNWISIADKQGFEALKEKPKSGRPTKMTEEIASEIDALLQEDDPQKYGYQIWDGPSLSKYIKEAYNIDYSVRSCQRLFRNLGYSLLRAQTFPSKDPDICDNEARGRFKAEVREIIDDSNCILVSQDEVHFVVQTTIGRKWAKKGSKPKVPSKVGKDSVGYSGFTVHGTGQLFMFEPERFTFETTIACIRSFLSALPAEDSRTVCLVMDNAPWHKKAKRLIREEDEYKDIAARIRFVELPPYSPDLNPIEQMWRVTRRECTHNQYFKSTQALKNTLSAYWAPLKEPNEKIKNLCGFSFTDKPIKPKKERDRKRYRKANA